MPTPPQLCGGGSGEDRGGGSGEDRGGDRGGGSGEDSEGGSGGDSEGGSVMAKNLLDINPLNILTN